MATTPIDRKRQDEKKPAPKLEDKSVVSYNSDTKPGQSFSPSQDNNFFMDRGRDFANFLGELVNPGRRNTIGGGYGDYLMGSNPVDQTNGLFGTYRGPAPAMNRGPIRSVPGRTKTPVEQAAPEMTLADYLSQASQLIGGQGGGGGVPGVSYDPQRNELRQRAGENDARLEAMYRQLRGSIEADAPKLQQGFQEARDSTQQNAATAQAQTQAATDSANMQNSQVLANLGIQQAQGNQIQQGTDLNTQTAQRIADQAVKGQAASDRLVSNEATALQHNTNIGNAAGLEGNLQRAANGSRLQALLAEIDMKEADQNSAIAAQNSQLGQRGMGDQLQLAQWLMGQATDERRYQDDLSMQAAQMAAKGQKTMPDLGTYLQSLGIDPAEIAKNPGAYGSLLNSLTKFNVQQ